MPKADFTLDTDEAESSKKRRGVRCSPFALFLLGLVLVSAVTVIIVLSVFFVQQNAQIFDLKDQMSKWNSSQSTQVIIAPTTPPQTIWTSYRLPTNLVPSHYDLHLQTFLPFNDAEANQSNAFTTKGNVTVHFQCVADTDYVILHAWNITIRYQHLAENDRTVELQPGVIYDPVRHLIILQPKEKLTVGKNYSLLLEFEGLIVGENQGFYRSFYEINGEKRWLATTQFQPYKARRAFPCFDEPSFRSTFTITIKHDSRHTGTYSVRKITGVKDLGDRWTETSFERTVRMPTYLLAFIVSDFQRKNETMPDGVDFGVISRAEALEDASLALRIGINMTIYSGTTLFDMPYKDYNSKMDMAAVPDFDAGAMENWGLIIYREIYMHHRVGITSAEDKKQIVRIVAHELAHMWFGNAVTCSWWSESFLNEGFATFMEYPLTHHAKPQWNLPTLFTATDTRVAYDTDSYESSIPLVREVNTPAEISDMFGRITYQKGGAVIRMMEGVMGTEDLYGALKSYLHRMRNSSITTYPDLLRALTDFIENKPYFANMTEHFENWLVTSGFPVVTIHRNGSTLSLHQERFLLGNTSTNATQQTWHVPISYVTNLDGAVSDLPNRQDFIRPKFWLEKKTAEHTMTATNASWILANVEHYGYYRVNYDNDNWDKLIDQLRTDHKIISVYSRTQLIDDSFSLARKGALNYTVPFKIMSNYMREEKLYPPWYAALDGLQYIDTMMGTSENPAFRDYMARLFQHHYDASYWNTTSVWRDEEHEDYQQLMLNRLFLEQSCFFDHTPCEVAAREEFGKWRANTSANPVDPHLRDQIFCYGMRNGTDADFDFMLEQYRTAQLHNVKLAVLRGLACSNQKPLLERLLNLSLDTTVIRSQDTSYVFRYLVKFYLGTTTAWDFLRTHWEELSRSLSRDDMITSVCNKFNTAEELAEVETFYASLGPNIREKLAFESAITKIKANIEWLRTYQQAVLDAMVGAESP